MTFTPCLVRSQGGEGVEAITLGHPLLDDYLAFVGARARTNTWLAVAADLKIFFGLVAKEPAEVTTARPAPGSATAPEPPTTAHRSTRTDQQPRPHRAPSASLDSLGGRSRNSELPP